MARPEKIVVELSPRDRKLFRDVLLKLATIADKNEDQIEQVIKPEVSPDHPGLKRLTEPAADEITYRVGDEHSNKLGKYGRPYIASGEGDWQLPNEQKVGEDD